MSKLNVDQKTIKNLFQDKKADFLIPDYQCPYAWGETECQTLWDDIFLFAIPDEGRVEFDSNSEYFLGPIVATVYKGNIIKNLIMDCQSYTKYRPNETTGGIFVSWRRKEELPTGA